MDKFEFTDLNRFLVSLGLALLLGSAAVVWLFLREPFDLTITVEALNKVTPTAQHIILERQRLLATAVGIVPPFALVSAVLGIGCLAFGLYRWVPYQLDYERIQRNLRLRSDIELRQMTSTEIAQKVRAEVEASRSVAAAPDQGQAPEPVEQAVADYLAMESTLLDTLAARLPTDYKVLTHQRSGLYTFDAVLRSPNNVRFMIEFKKLADGTSRRQIAEALHQVSGATAWYGIDQKEEHVPMLIAVTSNIDARIVEQANRFIRETSGNPTAFGSCLVRFLTPARLATLSARDVEALLDRGQRLLVFADDTDPPPHIAG